MKIQLTTEELQEVIDIYLENNPQFHEDCQAVAEDEFAELVYWKGKIACNYCDYTEELEIEVLL